MAHELHHRYPAIPTTPRTPRDHLAAFLADEGDGELIPLATLLTSELITNAVRHSGSTTVELYACHEGGTLRVSIADAGTRLPHIREPDLTGGRGLHIVEALASHWGVICREGEGKSTWFELDGDLSEA